MPIVGRQVRFLLLGGNIVGENALLRFYVLHCVLLPLGLVLGLSEVVDLAPAEALAHDLHLGAHGLLDVLLLLDEPEVLRDVLGADDVGPFEHHVLEEVAEAGDAGALVHRAHARGPARGHGGRLVALEEEPPHAVGEGQLLDVLDLDTDTVIGVDHASLGMTEIRYGRLFIDTGVGSELLPLAVPFEVQYYNGTAFVRNDLDSCTKIDDVAADGEPDLILSNNVEASPQTDGDVLICPGGTSTMTLADNPVALGAGNLSFSAPGQGCTGFAAISVDLGVTSPPGQNKPWLQYDWNVDETNDNPAGRVDFGIFAGQQQLIYTREPWN